ncbi:MAG: hypothetical protein K9H49_20315 [Bacteroidales bacterium]|nr:hypothetical protein [Saprospiraceae bacterium]MCF8381924.1 hypothetical protein [Bacteroidales bacterium]
MKRFISNLILLIAITSISYIFIYQIFYKVTIPKNINACYIWGDSQMVQDLDLDYLNNNSPYHFYSSAQHGAGIYDFLVFTELVPENSNVIISIGKGVFVRGKNMDRNESAINIKVLLKLWDNNYTIKEIYGIIRKNQQPMIFFHKKSAYPLFPNEDATKKIETVANLEKLYAQKLPYFSSLENLYIDGIRGLLNKNCKIIAIEFPFHPIANEIELKSPYNEAFISFEKKISELFEKKEIIEIKSKENIFRETPYNAKGNRQLSIGLIEIKSDDNIFRDLTHFNKRGAMCFTKNILPFIDFKDESLIIKVKQIEE